MLAEACKPKTDRIFHYASLLRARCRENLSNRTEVVSGVRNARNRTRGGNVVPVVAGRDSLAPHLRLLPKFVAQRAPGLLSHGAALPARIPVRSRPGVLFTADPSI